MSLGGTALYVLLRTKKRVGDNRIRRGRPPKEPQNLNMIYALVTSKYLVLMAQLIREPVRVIINYRVNQSYVSPRLGQKLSS